VLKCDTVLLLTSYLSQDHVRGRCTKTRNVKCQMCEEKCLKCLTTSAGPMQVGTHSPRVECGLVASGATKKILSYMFMYATCRSDSRPELHRQRLDQARELFSDKPLAYCGNASFQRNVNCARLCHGSTRSDFSANGKMEI